MKLFIMFVMVALLAALCLAQSVDNSAPEQPDTSEALRFKRKLFPVGHCPPGYIRVVNMCTLGMDVEHTDPNSAPDQPDTSGVLRVKRSSFIIGHCPPGYTSMGGFCIPDEDAVDAEHNDPKSAPDQPDTSGSLRFKRSGTIIIGVCPPGYTKRGVLCIPDDEYDLY